MKVCAKCATSKEFIAIVSADIHKLTNGQCSVCNKINVPVFERK